MGGTINLIYESSVEQLKELNSSFDKGVLRIAYTEKNRNNSYISKEVFEQCIGSMYNCPIVCHYDRESDSIGGHDVDIFKDEKGLHIANITQPVGVIPESAKYWWETIEEADGNTHEYLCTEAIIWKRQEAYQRIKENKITNESMEISVTSGRLEDGCYYIDSFEFTAFCLLESAEPCFESASLEMFSFDSFKEMYAKMMDDFKEQFKKVNSSDEDITNSTIEGGNALDKGQTTDKSVTEEQKDGANEGGNPVSYSLMIDQYIESFCAALSSQKYIDQDGYEWRRYSYYDADLEKGEVYAHDKKEHWNLYGFKFSLNGDQVIIDYDSRKKKKIVIADFEEGDANISYSYAFESYSKEISDKKDKEIADLKTEYEKTIGEKDDKIKDLEQYQKKKQADERKEAETALFARFPELEGVEAFEALRTNCSEMALDEIENKCFEIKGRNTANFSLNDGKPKPTRIGVARTHTEGEPYGGLFLRYPPKK